MTAQCHGGHARVSVDHNGVTLGWKWMCVIRWAWVSVDVNCLYADVGDVARTVLWEGCALAQVWYICDDARMVVWMECTILETAELFSIGICCVVSMCVV